MSGRGALRIAAWVLVAQLALALGYLWLERERSGGAAHGLERVAADRPALVLERPDGSTLPLSDLRGEPVLLHVWATWCEPCREELPPLLAWAEEAPLRVVAVTVDRDWAEVRAFLGGAPPPAVLRADSEQVTRALGTTALPDTFVLDAGGVTRARLRGPGDWSSSGLRRAVLRAAGAD